MASFPIPDGYKSAPLPKEFVDAHHHFLDTGSNSFQSFLGTLLPDEKYLGADYKKDVVQPLSEAGVNLVGSVHIECMPDDATKEVDWVESMDGSTVKAIVAGPDLASPSISDELSKLVKNHKNLKGVRWILDCVGKFEPGTATHVATRRHDGVDYLRGSEGGYDGDTVPEFERGYALLAKYNLTFDLQCAPIQLEAAAKLCKRHPDVRVVIDHLGKPRTLLGPDEPSNTKAVPNREELEQWRSGLKAIAACPNVYIKLSMLGYAVPGWIKKPERTALMKQLVLEVVELFTPQRCMVALNWWKSGAVSDADFLSDVGPSAVEYLQYMSSFLKDYSDQERQRMFCGTAQEFYRM